MPIFRLQQINADQAMALVRQRRDVNDESFTDLDRTRLRQAFIASLIGALLHNGFVNELRKMGPVGCYCQTKRRGGRRTGPSRL